MDGDGIDTGTTSIHVTQSDKKTFETRDVDDLQIGQLYHDAVDMADSFLDLQQQVKEELERDLADMKERANRYGLRLTFSVQIEKGWKA